MKTARVHPTHSRGAHMGDVIVEPTSGTVAELEKDLTWLEVTGHSRTPTGDAVIVPECDEYDMAWMLRTVGWTVEVSTGGAS